MQELIMIHMILKEFNAQHKIGIIITLLLFTSCTSVQLVDGQAYSVDRDFGNYTFLNDSIYCYRWRQGLLAGRVFGKYEQKKWHIVFLPEFETEFEKNKIIEVETDEHFSSLKVIINDSVEFTTIIHVVLDTDTVPLFSNENGDLNLPRNSTSFHIQNSIINHPELNFKLDKSKQYMHYIILLGEMDLPPKDMSLKRKYKRANRHFK